MNTKMIVLGLDGATWTKFDKFIAKGIMPNFASIINKGTRGTLLSNPPYTSGTAWTSIFTGVNPGKHGIPHHIIGGKQEQPSIWQILSDVNVKPIVVSDLITYPPLNLNGIMITGGFSTPSKSKNYVHPPDLFDEINKAVKGYIPALDHEVFEKIDKGGLNDFYEKLQNFADKVAKLSLYLAEKYEWQVLSTTIESTDYLHHFFWDKTNYLEEFYKWLDQFIGNLYSIANSNNANFFMVSDHGFGSIKKHFLVNSWLEKEGFTDFGKPGTVRKHLSKTKIKRNFIRKNLQKLRLRGIVSKIAPKELKKMVPIEQNESGFIQDQSRVYSEAYNEITVNVKDPGEYEKTREEIIKKLLQLRDKDENVILEAHKKEEIFSGPFINRAYDIQILLNNGYCWSPSIRDDYLIPAKDFGLLRTGDHRPEGIFFAIGPEIRKDYNLEKPIFTYDISPTIMFIFKQKIPLYMDGKVIKEIFEKSSTLYKNKIEIKKTGEREFLKRRISEIRHNLKI